MTQPGAIGRRVSSCIAAFQVKAYETALIHLFPAMDQTAKRRRPSAGVGERIQLFISDQEDIITAIALGNIIRDIKINGTSFPEAVYKYGRTAIVHEGELDRRLRVVEAGGMSVNGDVWTLPSSYLFAMTIGVMAAKENGREDLGFDGAVRFFDRQWRLKQIWGGEGKIRVTMSKIFPSS